MLRKVTNVRKVGHATNCCVTCSLISRARSRGVSAQLSAASPRGWPQVRIRHCFLIQRRTAQCLRPVEASRDHFGIAFVAASVFLAASMYEAIGVVMARRFFRPHADVPPRFEPAGAGARARGG